MVGKTCYVMGTGGCNWGPEIEHFCCLDYLLFQGLAHTYACNVSEDSCPIIYNTVYCAVDYSVYPLCKLGFEEPAQEREILQFLMFYGNICDTVVGYSASSQTGHIINSGTYAGLNLRRLQISLVLLRLLVVLLLFIETLSHCKAKLEFITQTRLTLN